MVLGIVSLTIPFTALTPCPIVGLVLGSIALHKTNKNPTVFSGKGFALAGVICCSVSILLTIVGLATGLYFAYLLQTIEVIHEAEVIHI
ncbi:MAG: DUF4190 domain-containing protein [Candidatus Brocadiales bacterium]